MNILFKLLVPDVRLLDLAVQDDYRGSEGIRGEI